MAEKEIRQEKTFNRDMMAKSLTTGIVVSTVTQTGRGVIVRIIRSPFAMLTVGVVVGFFAHKYRKKIISITSNAAEHSKEFILLQKQNIKEILLENDDTESKEKSD